MWDSHGTRAAHLADGRATHAASVAAAEASASAMQSSRHQHASSHVWLMGVQPTGMRSKAVGSVRGSTTPTPSCGETGDGPSSAREPSDGSAWERSGAAL